MEKIPVSEDLGGIKSFYTIKVAEKPSESILILSFVGLASWVWRMKPRVFGSKSTVNQVQANVYKMYIKKDYKI